MVTREVSTSPCNVTLRKARASLLDKSQNVASMVPRSNLLSSPKTNVAQGLAFTNALSQTRSLLVLAGKRNSETQTGVEVERKFLLFALRRHLFALPVGAGKVHCSRIRRVDEAKWPACCESRWHITIDR